jgi:hypothetical protein
MSTISRISALAGVSLMVAGCSGGGGGGGGVTRTLTGTLSQLSSVSQPSSAVEVTRRDTGEVMFSFVDGPLKDMVVICQDHAGAACNVVGGPQGTLAQGSLEARMSGQHAYAASLNIQHNKDGTLQNSHHRLYQATPGTAPGTVPGLPTGVGTYRGEFVAGAGVGAESGIAEGGITLTVNFNAGQVSGVMDGSMRGTATAVSASFNNVTIDSGTGQFTSTGDSSFLFNNALAGGVVKGGFYGPTADETAGVFEIGNTQGGMSGVFLGCQGAAATCVSHAR